MKTHFACKDFPHSKAVITLEVDISLVVGKARSGYHKLESPFLNAPVPLTKSFQLILIQNTLILGRVRHNKWILMI